jgi:hypothetical protein
MVVAFTAALPVVAQDYQDVGPPPIITDLLGEWEGSGTLLGRPAEFRMEWELVEPGFLRLSFTNSWIGADGVSTPVLSAQPTYLLNGPSAIGVWLDDRPQRLTLEARITDSSLVVHWLAEKETGRTEYLVSGPDSVVVRDFVFSEESERMFAEASYRRVTPTAGDHQETAGSSPRATGTPRR